MARGKISGSKPSLKEVLASASGRLVLKFPLFRILTAKQAAEIVSHVRFPNDPRNQRELLEVSKLDAKEVQRRLEASDPDGLGALAYKWCLTEEGADPRLRIAKRILSLIPIARRNLETGKPALELGEIFMLNDRANMLFCAPHLRRGLDNLAAGRAGGRRRNPAGREARQQLASDFLAARKVRPSLTQRKFVQSLNPPVLLKTLQRGLQDLGVHRRPKTGRE
jgi:hypothetical protein